MKYDEYNENKNLERADGLVRGLAIASLALGIASLLFYFLTLNLIITASLSCVGLMLGIIARVKGEKKYAVSGIITSSFGLGMVVVYLIFTLLANTVLAEFMKRLEEIFPESKPGQNLPGSNFSIKRVILTAKTFLKL